MKLSKSLEYKVFNTMSAFNQLQQLDFNYDSILFEKISNIKSTTKWLSKHNSSEVKIGFDNK